MVYCGKPSRGCQMCRTRRIKCDETKPTCNQCAKSRRQCPGYKDEFDLVFRNETQATERRAQKATKKALAHKLLLGKQESDFDEPANLGMEPISSIMGGSLKSSLQQSVIPALNIPVEQRANCHFVSNFVLIPRGGSTRGFMEYLVPLLKSDGPKKHLLHAFDACSLALLDNRSGPNSNLREEALATYTKALQGTHQALRDPETQYADSTLGAVLMLGLFENITAKQIGTLAWGSHIEGAIQLAKARGKKGIRTKVGLGLFLAVRTQLIIHTLTSGKPPAMGAEWWTDDAARDQHATSCQRIMIKTGELRAEVTRMMNTIARTPDNVEVMLDMIRRAQHLDSEMVKWMDELPEFWRYRTIAWEDNVPNGDYSKAEVFPGRVDIYTDFWICSVWNMARTARLILSSIIVRCAAWVCSPVDYRTTPEYATAARTCVDTITDIIASIPYNLGWHLKRNYILEKARLSGFACGEEDSTKVLAGYFATWPLTCLSSQDYTTDAQRQWVHGRLEYIGNEFGVRYAHILKAIQLRVPSMMIRRDGLMASPYGAAQNFERLVSARLAPPLEGYALNPLQQREAMQKAQFEQRRAELVTKITGGDKDEGKQWVTQKWLAV